MHNDLANIHKQVSALYKTRLPQLSLQVQSLSLLLKVYGEKLIEHHHMHVSYKSSSEEYMQILLEEIRVRTRQIEEKSRHSQSSFDHSSFHKVSCDEANESRTGLDWGDVYQVLEEAFGANNTVRKGAELLETLNYQINLDKLKNKRQTAQFIEWLQDAHRYKDEEIKRLLEFCSFNREIDGESQEEKEDKVEVTYPNMILLIQNEFLNMCETQKGYIRSIQQLNHQVQQLISQITTRELNHNNDDQTQRLDTEDNKQNVLQEKQRTLINIRRDNKETERSQKQLQYVMNDYEKLKAETNKLRQLLKSSANDFLPIQRQLARHINIGNILQTQINRVIREFNLHEDSFWEMYELPQVESVEGIVSHLVNINERMEHMTGKVNKILKCHVETKRNKNELKINYIMQSIEELLKNKEPQLEQIEQVCSEVKNLTDALLKDEGLGKGLLRVILGLDNLFSLLPISDSAALGMIEEQKQKLLKLVGGMANHRHQKSEERDKQNIIIAEYEKEIVELKKQNEWLTLKNETLASEAQSLKEALEQIKSCQQINDNNPQIHRLEARIKELSFENGMFEERLRDEKVKFEREKTNLHIEVRKTSVKLERLEKLALRKMDINAEKPPINIKKGKVVINSHL